MKTKKKAKKKPKKSKEQIKADRLKKNLQKKIISSFKSAGFEYLKTENVHKRFGVKNGEVDFVFLHENLILICEDTTADSSIKEHMHKTKHLFDNIKNDFDQHKYKFLEWLRTKYPDKFELFDDYDDLEYQFVFLYVHKKELSNEDIEFMDYIKCINENTLKYLSHISDIVKLSSRDEFLRFLEVNSDRIGRIKSSQEINNIDTTIISPEPSSGFKKMKIVSFLMNAEDLMDCGYVLRKDNWEGHPELYQRLLQKSKIKSIREYLINEKRGFINNVIVSLPKETRFYRKNKEIDFDSINNIENLKVSIPRKRNTIGIIDGQHRVYSHYRSNTKEEEQISKLRQKLHILVTALVFDKSVKDRQRRVEESKLFMEINHNTKKVSGDVLLHIKSLQDPFSPEGTARRLILKLNKEKIFLNKFEISSLNKSEIKTTSLIRYGLNEFVDLSDTKETFFKYWKNDNKERLKNIENDDFEEIFELYFADCFDFIKNYFKAVKRNFKSEWDDSKNNKIFSMASINGFLLALKKSLSEYGIQDFGFYSDKLKGLKEKDSSFNFNKDKFLYSSSKGWGEFSKLILRNCFDIDEQN